MKHYPILLIFSLLSLLGCSESPSFSRLDDDAVILAFGDSLTKGYGVKASESYPAVLQGLSGYKVINAGISGEESSPGLKRLPALLERHRPGLLILCHGGNDILKKRNLKRMEDNLLQMVNLADQKGIPVVLIGVPKPGIFLSPYEAYENIADSTNVIFIDELLADVLSDNSLKSDTVHPNAKGYKVMAETVYSVLQKYNLI